MPAALLSQPTLAFAPESALTSAFLEANRSLRASKVDDSLSGTTAITMLVRGASLCVSNVGDSRACLAEDTGRALAAINLSCDQTPFRCEQRWRALSIGQKSTHAPPRATARAHAARRSCARTGVHAAALARCCHAAPRVRWAL